jgi:hypothetical protein
VAESEREKEGASWDCFASYKLDTLGLLELSSDNISRDERRMLKRWVMLMISGLNEYEWNSLDIEDEIFTLQLDSPPQGLERKKV